MANGKPNILLEKVECFTDRIIKMSKYLRLKGIDKYIVDQVSRAGTSIGANVHEGVFAQSKADFISKYQIALKEANETAYWLRKIYKGGWFTQQEFDSIIKDCNEIIRLLSAIVKKAKENM